MNLFSFEVKKDESNSKIFDVNSTYIARSQLSDLVNLETFLNVWTASNTGRLKMSLLKAQYASNSLVNTALRYVVRNILQIIKVVAFIKLYEQKNNLYKAIQKRIEIEW